jgi:uncharacterized protein YecT (DUF1311 family)
MPKRVGLTPTVRWATPSLCLISVALTAGCGGSHQTKPAQTGKALKPPLIHEPFTLLPCPAHPDTTLAMEGCTEKMILASDHAIDVQVKTIFDLLIPTARSRFVQSEESWLRYRRASCLTEASKYQGGTFQPVAFAECVVDRSQTHLKDLAELKRVLAFH